MSLATAPNPTGQLVPDLCYVENTSDESVTLKYEFKPYVFPPGEKRLAPRAAINTWFGDPSLADHPTDPRRKSRTDAAKKVACYQGIFIDQPWTDPATGESRFWTHLKVYDFDGTTLLPTIHIDPYGETLAAPDDAALENASMVDQMNQMKLAVAQMQALLAEQGIEADQTVATEQPVTKVDKPEPSDPEGGAVPDSSSAPKAKKQIQNRTVKP